MPAAKALIEMTPEEIVQEVKVGPAWPRRRRVPDRAEVGVLPPAVPGRREIRALQRRRRRSRARSWTAAFSRRIPHAVLEGMVIAAKAIGATSGLHLLPGRVPAGGRSAQPGHRRRHASTASWGKTFWGRASISIWKSTVGAGAFVCGEETALHDVHRGKAGRAPGPDRPSRPSRVSGKGRRCSTTWRPWPTSPRSS